MSTPARFSDGQYKNWLKCSQSLIIMKEALHDYIDDEVKKLHGDITQKVSSIPYSSSTGNRCVSCRWVDIELTGVKPRNWFVNCRICDKWLWQILAFHDDPYNPNINWKNADIRKWPTDCYEVAKIFMPKGQDKTTKMPDDLDAPAILSLMKYCKWFRKDLPNKQILSDLKKEDIDIDFRETEIRALRNSVSNLESEVTTLKENRNLMQSQLSERVQRLGEETTENTKNAHTLEADIERMRKSLDSLNSISDKMASFFDKNPDILDIIITDTLKKVIIDVQNLQIILSKMETDIKATLSNLKEEIKQVQKGFNKQFKGVKRKLDKQTEEIEQFKERLKIPKEANSRAHENLEQQRENDEQPSLHREATRERRPETDGLKQLKYQTEDNLNTHRKLQCIPTIQAEKAKKLLQKKRAIVIKGNPGEGKTTTALNLIDNEIYKGKRVVLYFPKDWKKVDTEWVDVVVLEDMFGQFDLDSGRLQDWMVYLPTIQKHVDAGKLQVIITTRNDILSKAYPRLQSLKLFSHDLSLMLSSEQLTHSEKISILNRQLDIHKKNMKTNQKEKCIANFSGLIGFPQCCSLFAADSKSFDRGPEFFRSPRKFFIQNISELAPTRFLSLAFLFCNGAMYEEHLSPETMPESIRGVLKELASYLQISTEGAFITLLRDVYDNFMHLYVAKFILYDLESEVVKSCIWFNHATVFEAVGQVLGKRCPEMFVKYCDSEYLYQKTDTDKDVGNTSENVFIPVSVYGLFARRMIDDVVKGGLSKSVVKHSALKQLDFVMALKCELSKTNKIKDFFITGEQIDHWFAETLSPARFDKQSSEEKCITFMQYVMQSDKDVVRLVCGQLLDFLACAHDKNNSFCWQCKEKQQLMELALYYHHSKIADKLVIMNASYTHVSLNNAARNGDLHRVQTILETLKRGQVFNPGCEEAKDALCRAYLSGNQSLIRILLEVEITLDFCHVEDAIRSRNVNVLMNLVEHLKYHNKWNPQLELNRTSVFDHPMVGQEINLEGLYFTTYFCYLIKRCPEEMSYFKAMLLTYYLEQFDMTDYLLKNEVKVSMDMLNIIIGTSSQQAVTRIIQHLKDSGNWNPKSDDAFKALENAYQTLKYVVCDLLIQEGVPLAIKNLPSVVYQGSFEQIKKAIENLKDTGKWDPKCDYASKALQDVYCQLRFGEVDKKYDVFELLVNEGISLTMKDLPSLVEVEKVLLKTVKKVIQNLKDTDNWNPNCSYASEALQNALDHKKYDMCDLLLQEGVSVPLKNLHSIINCVSFENIKKAIQHLKDTDIWDPKSVDASKTLEIAYGHQKYDVCDLLAQEGVLLTMKSLPSMTHKLSFDNINKAIQHLKDTENWNSECDDASKALEIAYICQKDSVCNLLVQEGVTLTVENLQGVVSIIPFEDIKKSIQQLKDTDSWNPKCEDASEALKNAYVSKKYDVCSLLIQEGVTLLMKNLPSVLPRVSFETLKNIIKHLKETANWDPKCNDATASLTVAYFEMKEDVFDLLVQEGVSLTMQILPSITEDFHVSMRTFKKAIQHLKDTNSWDPTCDDASEALENASSRGFKSMDNVFDVLLQEGISLTMKTLPHLVCTVSYESIKKAIQHLKDTDNWDPKCEDASQALANAYFVYSEWMVNVSDLLIQEGVHVTMKTFPDIVQNSNIPLKILKTIVQQLKKTDNWDPKCDDASKAFEYACYFNKYDVCDLLIQEGVSLTMKNFPGITKHFCVSLNCVKKIIQHLKDTDNWDPKCAYATKALENAYTYDHKSHDLCDLLVQEGASLTMKIIPRFTKKMHISGTHISMKTVKKAIQNLKDTDNWNPQCDDANEALENAYNYQMYDVFQLLVNEGVSVTMKNLPNVVVDKALLTNVKNVIQNMKETENWNPKCDNASRALEKVYSVKMDDVCDMLVHEGVTLTMKNLPGLAQRFHVSLEIVRKAIQHLKDTNNWDPKCEDASEALEKAYVHQKYDVCDLLAMEGVSLTMKNLPGLTHEFHVPLTTVTKAIQHLKDTDNWNPICDDASKALENAYGHQKYDVCDLLIQEGMSLTVKNLLGLTQKFHLSMKIVKKIMLHLKGTDKWNPKCDDASKVLAKAYGHQNHDVCDLLIHEGVSLTMKHFADLTEEFHVPLKIVKNVIQHLKDNDNWYTKCDDASKGLENLYVSRSCLLVQERASLAMKNLRGLTRGFHVPLQKYHVLPLQNYDVCDMLAKEGVSLTMKNLPGLAQENDVPLQIVRKAIQQLKDNDNWDPKCDEASQALEKAYGHHNHDVCDLLVKEGVSLTMKNLPGLTQEFHVPLKTVRKAILNLKDTDNWDPKCADASKALEKAYGHQKYDVCDLLAQEGVSLTMTNLPSLMQEISVSLKSVKKAIQHLKDTDNWDHTCDNASKALEKAYGHKKYDMCDLLAEEGVSLTIKNLPALASFQDLIKAVQHLKDTDRWNPKCDYSSKVLEKFYMHQKYDVCDQLVQEGVSLSMKNLPGLTQELYVSLTIVRKAIQHLKDTDNWDPKCDDASKALEQAYGHQNHEVCDLLTEEGVFLTMKNLPGLTQKSHSSLKIIKNAIQHLKHTDSWNPNCDDASMALANAYAHQRHDVCDLLAQEGMSLTVKNLLGLSQEFHLSIKIVKKAIQHLKGTDKWNPKCDDASKMLAKAYGHQNHDVCDLLIHEGVSLTMKHFADLTEEFHVPLKIVKNVIQHLKDNDNWYPKFDDASKARENAYVHQKYDVCDLLAQEGVSLTMKNLPGLTQNMCVSLKTVTKAIQHLKDTGSWDPKCEDASKALENAYGQKMYDLCDLLAQEGVLLTMKNLPGLTQEIYVPLKTVRNAIQL